MTDVHFAIERGYRQLAAKLVADAVRIGGYGYNFLHEEVKYIFEFIVLKNMVVLQLFLFFYVGVNDIYL